MGEAGTETMAAALHPPSRSHLTVFLRPTLAKPRREENSASIDQLSSVEIVQRPPQSETETAALEKSDNVFILLCILQDCGAYMGSQQKCKNNVRKNVNT